MANLIAAYFVALILYMVFFPGFLVNVHIPPRGIDGRINLKSLIQFLPIRNVMDKKSFLVTMVLYGAIFAGLTTIATSFIADAKVEDFSEEEQQ